MRLLMKHGAAVDVEAASVTDCRTDGFRMSWTPAGAPRLDDAQDCEGAEERVALAAPAWRTRLQQQQSV